MQCEEILDWVGSGIALGLFIAGFAYALMIYTAVINDIKKGNEATRRELEQIAEENDSLRDYGERSWNRASKNFLEPIPGVYVVFNDDDDYKH